MHVIYARRAYISSRRVDRTERIQLHTALHVYYVYCTVLKHTNTKNKLEYKEYIYKVLQQLYKAGL